MLLAWAQWSGDLRAALLSGAQWSGDLRTALLAGAKFSRDLGAVLLAGAQCSMDGGAPLDLAPSGVRPALELHVLRARESTLVAAEVKESTLVAAAEREARRRERYMQGAKYERDARERVMSRARARREDERSEVWEENEVAGGASTQAGVATAVMKPLVAHSEPWDHPAHSKPWDPPAYSKPGDHSAMSHDGAGGSPSAVRVAGGPSSAGRGARGAGLPITDDSSKCGNGPELPPTRLRTCSMCSCLPAPPGRSVLIKVCGWCSCGRAVHYCPPECKGGHWGEGGCCCCCIRESRIQDPCAVKCGSRIRES